MVKPVLFLIIPRDYYGFRVLESVEGGGGALVRLRLFDVSVGAGGAEGAVAVAEAGAGAVAVAPDAGAGADASTDPLGGRVRPSLPRVLPVVR